MIPHRSDWSETGSNLPPRDHVRALLIDDDQDNVSMVEKLSRRSRRLQISLTTCCNVDDALTAIAAQKFDALYIDYSSRLETSIAFIYKFANEHDTPCILLTSLDQPEIRRVAFRAGVQGFLSKEELSTQAIESVTLSVLNRRC